jgi:hypothetical protein
MTFGDACNTTEMVEIEKYRILVKFCFNIAINSFLQLWIAKKKNNFKVYTQSRTQTLISYIFPA